MNFSDRDIERIKLVYQDLLFIGENSNPDCTDEQLRRISVELRKLLIEDHLRACWSLLDLEPKQPIIIAPKLRTEDLGGDAIAYAGGGQIGGLSISGFRSQKNSNILKMSESKYREYMEQGKKDIEYPFPLHEYKESCAVFYKGTRIRRDMLIQFVANRKGGVHFGNKGGNKRKEKAYRYLDMIYSSDFTFAGVVDELSGEVANSKNPIFMEMLSIGQNIFSSPDIQKLIDTAQQVCSIREKRNFIPRF